MGAQARERAEGPLPHIARYPFPGLGCRVRLQRCEARPRLAACFRPGSVSDPRDPRSRSEVMGVASAPVVLHIFSTFAVGGPQTRFAAIANHFGAAYRHIVVGMDGNYACAERLAPEL